MGRDTGYSPREVISQTSKVRGLSGLKREVMTLPEQVLDLNQQFENILVKLKRVAQEACSVNPKLVDQISKLHATVARSKNVQVSRAFRAVSYYGKLNAHDDDCLDTSLGYKTEADEGV